jgi:F-type H+-transporting ATPase subunit alpha
LRQELGGGSLTALPIIETEAQDIAAYIPTNLISITDGQLYLSPTLFELGVLPAIDVAKSVSRVGSAAQRAPYRAVAGKLKLAYSQFEELEEFSRFGTRLDEHTQQIIGHGKRIRACLGQPQFAAVPVLEQIVLLQSLTGGLLDAIPLERVSAAETALRAAIAQLPDALRQRCLAEGDWNAADATAVAQIAAGALAAFKA